MIAMTIELVAHRGNARDFPENTLPAIRSAIELGARFVEFDVQLSADAVPMVIHDHELQRTAGVPGSVFDYSAAELSQIEVNERSRLGERYSAVRLPRLDDVVDLLLQHPQVTPFVEIKRASLRRFSMERVVAEVLKAVKPLGERCVIISFDLPAVFRARQSGCAIGWVLTSYDEHARLKFEALQPEYLFVNHDKLPADGRLWMGPWRWVVYEVDRLELAQSLSARGAHAIETMAVADMMQALRSA
jgi:glycerophosphoryl diester phosphodiesterase